MKGITFYIVKWYGDENVIGFPTEEARTKWMAKNTESKRIYDSEYEMEVKALFLLDGTRVATYEG